MELGSINTPAAAFIAGLVTSLHCVGMCGPLACWLTPVRRDEDATTIFATYQGARLASYLALGVAAGALGGVPLGWLDARAALVLPWALVVFFLVVGLRLDKRLPKPMIAVRTALRLQAWTRGKSRVTTAAVLGAATPLVPCGPLYFIAGVAALSGSAVRGAEFMLAFGLGTLPLLWIAQSRFGWVRSRLNPLWVNRLQLGAALVAAVVITWRLRSTFGFAGPVAGEWVCF